MWLIFIHLRVIIAIVADFCTFEGKFIHLWEFIHLRVQQPLTDKKFQHHLIKASVGFNWAWEHL